MLQKRHVCSAYVTDDLWPFGVYLGAEVEPADARPPDAVPRAPPPPAEAGVRGVRAEAEPVAYERLAALGVLKYALGAGGGGGLV